MQLAIVSVSLVSSLFLAAPGPAEYRISGPYTHENLSIFLIHSKNSGGKKYLTLQQAMEQKKVVVHETSNVNELAVENISDHDIFLQSGDIVKGGQQDRMLTNDFVLSPRSGKVPVSAFCVEQGRWSRRGAEPVQVFASSTWSGGTKELKLAVRAKNNQAEVWREVDRVQGALEQSAGLGARVPSSMTSLQLSVESPSVTNAIEGYRKTLSGVIAGKPDAVGFAFALNGAVNSADVYSSPELFAAMWPKLLNSSAVEAIARRQSGKTFSPPSVAGVEALLRGAGQGKASTADINRRVQLATWDSDNQVLFESRDGGAWIHRNYIKK